MAGKNRKNILILDPERDTAELFSRALENYHEGYKCYWVSDPQQARSLLCEIPFSFLIADISMLQKDHFFLLNSIQGLATGTKVIANGYVNDQKSIRTAMGKGAAGYFIKPVMVCALRKLIDDFSGK
ncbi:MAG: response regulator [Syntrophobacteraceae bacterium]